HAPGGGPGGIGGGGQKAARSAAEGWNRPAIPEPRLVQAGVNDPAAVGRPAGVRLQIRVVGDAHQAAATDETYPDIVLPSAVRYESHGAAIRGKGWFRLHAGKIRDGGETRGLGGGGTAWWGVVDKNPCHKRQQQRAGVDGVDEPAASWWSSARVRRWQLARVEGALHPPQVHQHLAR